MSGATARWLGVVGLIMSNEVKAQALWSIFLIVVSVVLWHIGYLLEREETK